MECRGRCTPTIQLRQSVSPRSGKACCSQMKTASDGSVVSDRSANFHRVRSSDKPTICLNSEQTWNMNDALCIWTAATGVAAFQNAPLSQRVSICKSLAETSRFEKRWLRPSHSKSLRHLDCGNRSCRFSKRSVFTSSFDLQIARRSEPHFVAAGVSVVAETGSSVCNSDSNSARRVATSTSNDVSTSIALSRDVANPIMRY